MQKASAAEVIREAKRLGFSDEQIAKCQNTDEATIRTFRKNANILPVVKQIDTLAAEWPAKTNYLYLTYGGDEDDIELKNDISKVIVLGAGVFRIGSSVEFDWCGVNTIWALKKNGIQEAIMVNYNPETVSTDYDVSDKLYFEELTIERILDIYEKENPLGVITSVGGQIPNNLAMKLSNAGVKLLGTSAENVDLAEDRSKFSALLRPTGNFSAKLEQTPINSRGKTVCGKNRLPSYCATQATCFQVQRCAWLTTKRHWRISSN